MEAIKLVKASQAIGQLDSFSAAQHIRTGRLVPILLQRMSDHIGLHIYYGSRAAQLKRVRPLLPLALDHANGWCRAGS
jgi:DNA-binding transcriptional LysR family regulator